MFYFCALIFKYYITIVYKIILKKLLTNRNLSYIIIYRKRGKQYEIKLSDVSKL